MYKIYILKCSDNTLYTGITTDLNKRLKQHNGEILGGAKYTLSRKPVKLIYSENAENRSTASKRECEIKKLTKKQKMELIENFNNRNMKKQVILVKGGESKENYKDYYEFLEKQKYEPFKDEIKRWNRTLGEKLGDDYEVLIHKTFNKDYSDYKSWKIMFEKMLPFFRESITFVGHSMGAIFLAKYFEEENFYHKLSKLNINVSKIILIAPPFKDIKNDVLGDFNFKNTEFKNLKKIQDKIKIFASKDDFVVPYDDIEDYQKVLPKIEYKIFEDRGHFLQEEFEELIEEIRK